MSEKLNIERTRNLLQNFEFSQLFREELGWSSPKSSAPKTEVVKEISFTRKPIAELGGAIVFEITLSDGSLPDSATRKHVSKYVRGLHFENVCVFVDKGRTQSIWHWEKKQDKKMMPRDHFYMRGQPGDLFITKLSSLVVDLSDFDRDGNISIAEVATRMKAALDVETVTKKFYKSYQEEFNGFLEFIQGINDENDRKWYASVILNRLMFIYFLQRKFFLDNGNPEYLSDKLDFSKKNLGKNKYYDVFLNALFFEGFAKEEKNRTAETNKLIGTIKYLNGGLFLQHKIEKKYSGKIKIDDQAFENLFSLFKSYSWNLNDTPGGQDNELNPDVLGYIFEKYINQKAFGAYYTRTEITEYLCEQTVYKLILDSINGPAVTEELEKKAKIPSRKKYDRIEELLIDLNADTCRKLVVGDNSVLPSLSLLDPACGSGAFLVAAMKTLINIYAAILGRIKFLGDKKLKAWLEEIERNHPSVNYYIKKQIITYNLYGVDLMEEASEIAKLRLFLALVASAEKVDDLEPLPNIDFNIMCGNSLVGLVRVDEGAYNLHQKADMFKKSYSQLVSEREAAIRAFKLFEGDREVLQSKKEVIDRIQHEANSTLNLILGQEFTGLGIKYEEITWDKKNNTEGKSLKRNITIKDMEALTPFHWGYEFSEIFRRKNGFDAIITNPPWEVFQTNEKEFFQQFNKEIKKKKLRIEDWEKDKEKLMKDDEIRQAWLLYSSQYPHQWSYFKKAHQYRNQTSVVNGKAVGNKPNLYALFTEQCKTLLRPGGYCGIVIPSGIYTDLGTMKLRQMLFDECLITGLFCFENRKTIFENVDSRFKFVVLTFEKGSSTIAFPAAFMRQDVEELEQFPRHGGLNISVKLLKEQSPDSYSIFEYKNEMEVAIAEKASHFPLLGANDGWNFELYGEELNMTRSAKLFKTKKTPYPLFEGGMVHHFNNRFAEPRYWLDEKDIREDFQSKRMKRIDESFEMPGDLLNDYESYRIAIRKIARSTDTRTLICTVIPKYSLTGNSLSVNFPYLHDAKRYNELRLTPAELVVLNTMLSSFVVDFILRMRITTNLNLFYLNQLPIPRLPINDSNFQILLDSSLKLICTHEEFSDLWVSIIHEEWTKESGTSKDVERNALKATLDACVAHIYGLTEQEFQYVLGTFPLISEEIKQHALEMYRTTTTDLNDKTSHSVELRKLIAKGENKSLEFKSTLSWDIKEGAKKHHIEHSVLKTIAAFLNSEGGTLLIGVTDDGQIHGLDDDFQALGIKGDPRDNFNKAFDNLINNNFGKSIHRLVHLTLVQIDGRYVGKVEVKGKSPEEVFLSNREKNNAEEFYIRLNASSVTLSGKDQSKYIREHWK
jgi:hypothetical protein